MLSSEEKFRKLLAAYEDEVQRKQHKMGKRVDPRDVAQPNPISGYCPFLRGEQQIVWSPSFDVIGTYDPTSHVWAWGWSDASLSVKVRGRIDAVRKQGIEWKIDVLTQESMTLANEDQAWELSTVATAVARADAMYRFVDGNLSRFLALYDAPPPSRSSASMIPAAPRAETQRVSMAGVPSAPSTASMRIPTIPRINTPTPPSLAAVRPSSMGFPAVTSNEREPSLATRVELGDRILQAIPPMQHQLLGAATLLAQAIAPNGPVGALSVELRITLHGANGADLPIAANTILHDAVVSLWHRVRERNGLTFRLLTARYDPLVHGREAQITFE